VAGGFTRHQESAIQAFEPIQSVSLKEACLQKIEGMIISGDLAPGERLPSERDLAVRLGVSRPVLHQAIVALDAKGLVRIEPRHGVFVCDFRRDGSMALLLTLMQHQDGVYQPELLSSLIQARLLIETETARLAALHRSEADLIELRSLFNERDSITPDNIAALVEYDFNIHQLIAASSGNLMYALILNSLKQVHTNLAGAFYRAYASTQVAQELITFHQQLFDAIAQQDPTRASQVMATMLKHGETHLIEILPLT
jgi:GntR family transcriptional repressor for pyruvate dehydrogenase complex